ncbi:MAG: hypothetical protein F6K35_17305, partial [Okeania sp. SIO2H7]|nr:hypothetical protein [Okeania sp. SIO2H7]
MKAQKLSSQSVPLMISPDNPQSLPIEDPFNSDPLEKSLLGSEEGPKADHYDLTSIDGNGSEGSLPSIEEIPIDDLLLVEGGKNIEAGRLLEGVRDIEKGDLLTGKTHTKETTEDTLISGRTKSEEIAPVKIQPRVAISYLEIEDSNHRKSLLRSRRLRRKFRARTI